MQLQNRYHRFYLSLRNLVDIVWDAISNFMDNGQTNQAAAISLYAILSFIPFVILTFIIAGYIFGTHPEIKANLITTINYINPPAAATITTQIGALEEKPRALGGLGLITLIWFSSMVFGAIETAFNITFRVQKPRTYIFSKALAIAMIPLAWLVGVTSIAVSSLATILSNVHVPMLPSLTILRGVMFRFVIPFVITVLLATLVYKIIPPIRLPWKVSLTAAFVFSLLVEPTKHLFSWYVAHYAKYSLIYGSLETIIVLVFWIFYIAIIFLFCAEMMASYLRRDIILLEHMFSRRTSPHSLIDERLVRKFGRHVPHGSYVFHEGDLNSEMYYVIQGGVRIEKDLGRIKKTLMEIGPGRYFGEMAALIDAPRTASAYAIEDSTLVVIGRDKLRDLIRKSEPVSLLMLQEFSHRLKNTSHALEESSKAATTLYCLLYVIEHWQEGGIPEVTKAISTATGRDPADIEMVMGDLEAHGILTRDGSRIVAFQREHISSYLEGLSLG